jgi:hypothetical protein
MSFVQFETRARDAPPNSSPNPLLLEREGGFKGNLFIFWFPLFFQERGLGGEFGATVMHSEPAGKAVLTIAARASVGQ